MIVAAAAGAAPVAWLVARAAGIVAFALLTISVTLGLALSTKLLGNRRGKMLLGWHQTLHLDEPRHGRAAPRAGSSSIRSSALASSPSSSPAQLRGARFPSRRES